MKAGKLLLGIGMVGIAYFGLFVPKTFEIIEKYISIQSIQGVGFLLIGVGIIGFVLICGGLN